MMPVCRENSLSIRWVGLWAIMLIMGCSEGDRIPLEPPSPLCERPVDHGWYALNNICNNRTPRDAVWPEGLNPVVVGDDGLILESHGPNRWTEQNLGLSENLTLVSANENGDLVAAGELGALAIRYDQQWHLETSLESVAWRDVQANGQQFWLAGDGGALATGIPGQAWQTVDFPDTTDLLTVCAFEDSVFVGGRDGLFSVLVDGQWHNIAPAQWGQADVASMVHMPDGRMVVWADSLMIREPSGWASPVDSYYIPSFQGGRLKYREGFLWYPYSSAYVGLNLSDYSEYQWLYFHNRLVEGTPGPEGQVFGVTNEGGLGWHLLQEDQTLQWKPDLAGPVDLDELFRLQDGTVVSPADYILGEITPTGLEEVTGLSAEIITLLRFSTHLAGESLSDFYLTQGDELNHCQNGELVWQEEVPFENSSSIKDLKMDQEGKLFLITRNLVASLENYQWTAEVQSEDHFFNNQLFLTQNGTFALYRSSHLLYSSTQGMIPIPLDFSPKMVSEQVPGILEILGSFDPVLHQWWEKGTGATLTVETDLVPGCPAMGISLGCETSNGVFIVTGGHSMVLKLPENITYGNWGLVAGPSEYEISDLEVLPGGELVTINESIHYLMGYRPSGF